MLSWFRLTVTVWVASVAMALAGCGALSPGGTATSPASKLSARPTATSAPIAPSPTPLSEDERIEAWRAQNASTFSALGDAITALGSAMKDTNFSAMHAACTDIVSASDSMHNALPSPDTGLNAALNRMLDSLAAATTTCPSVGPDSAESTVDGFLSNLKVARGQFDIAAEILSEARK
jgi:hypothetical protein